MINVEHPSACFSVYPQRRCCQKRLTDRSLRGKDLRLWFGPRHPQRRQLHRPGQRQCPAASHCLWPTRPFKLAFFLDKHHCTHRLDFLWSGCLQRASFSASTRCRATSGPMEFCCGRSSHWVSKHIISAVHLPLSKQTAVLLRFWPLILWSHLFR